MKILFAGPIWPGSNALSMANGFAQLGHDVRTVDTATSRRTGPAILRHINRVWPGHQQKASSLVAEEIRTHAADWNPDMLFCFKTVALDQSVLLGVSAPLKVSYSPDDVSNPVNTSVDYLQNEQYWDLIVTTKSYNVGEIRQRTGQKPNVLFVMSAYDPAWHARQHTSAKQKNHAVGFIGHYRPDRLPLLDDLASQYGNKLVIYGGGWKRRSVGAALAKARIRPPAYASDFSEAVGGITSNLVLLNSDNRDLHTCRTFEIPAAGGLFVGERTAEHSQLIEHGRDGYLFSSQEELTEILDFIERNPNSAQDVARCGWVRITTENHRYVDRAAQIVNHVNA